MNIEIGKPLKKIKYKNTFKFVIDFMYGDADGYGKETVLLDKNDKYLERFINFLENCKKAYPHGRGGYDDYNEDVVKDFWLFAEEDSYGLSEEQKEELETYEGPFLQWQWDPAGDGIMASFDGYTLTFFDSHGVEHNTTIKF